jgi:hypothetical protein
VIGADTHGDSASRLWTAAQDVDAAGVQATFVAAALFSDFVDADPPPDELESAVDVFDEASPSLLPTPLAAALPLEPLEARLSVL